MKNYDCIKRIKKRLLQAPSSIEPGNTPAAVLVALVPKNDSLFVVFTRRSMSVATHKGQVSLPGGVEEATDASSGDTALREAHEEIGLAPDCVSIIGYLDSIKTITNFWVTPVVGVVAAPVEYIVEDREVEEVFEVPLAALLDGGKWRLEKRVYQNVTYDDCRFVYGEHVIWGATGKMMYSFAQRMSVT